MSAIKMSPNAILALSVVALTSVKLLLLPSSVYRSTDFDVHRNWLALTRNLPPERWYYDDVNGTTVHTLDYPPGFALFEAALSRNPITDGLLKRGHLDGRCLELLGDHDNDPSGACVAFHRLTVILGDVFLIAGAAFASRSVLAVDPPDPGAEVRSLVTALLVLFNPGLLLLDHVHFQYNGMLLGLLLLSIGCIARGARSDVSAGAAAAWDVAGAVIYAALLTMKHLYIILGPLYFSYLLRHHCYAREGGRGPKFSPRRFGALAAAAGTALVLPFVPFLLSPPGPAGQLRQILRRLFPFQRGLCHDYWAANVWALYLFGDKCLRFALRRVGAPAAGLPDVPPSAAALCLAAGLVPACACAWGAAYASPPAAGARLPLEKEAARRYFFVHAAVFSSFSGFMLAYHVHEKAIMTAIIPLTLLSTMSRDHARLYLRTCALGHFGLLPLLFRPEELIFKAASYIAFLALAVSLLEGATADRGEENGPRPLLLMSGSGAEPGRGLLTIWDKMGLAVLAAIAAFMEVAHPLLLRPRGWMEFLPLMATSVACAAGLVGCWARSGALMVRCAGDLMCEPGAHGDRGEKKHK